MPNYAVGTAILSLYLYVTKLLHSNSLYTLIAASQSNCHVSNVTMLKKAMQVTVFYAKRL